MVTQPAARAFLPDTMPVLRRAQIGALVSNIHTRPGADRLIEGIGRGVTVPAGMVPDAGWNLASSGELAGILAKLGAVIVPV